MKNGTIYVAALACTMLSATALLAQTQPANDQSAGQPSGGEQPAAPTALTTPVMPGPLAANPNPTSFDLGPLGPVYVTGAVTGLGLWQNNPFPADQRSLASLSNGQFFFQKNDGLFQYYVQVGAYTIPSLGAPYFNTPKATGDFFGPLPMAWVKVAPTDTFSIQGGKLPTLIGAENTFTFQNMNIERGLLWAQEPAISRGGQLNYTAGPLALAFSFNDGFYSNRYTWLSGSATYTIDTSNNVVLAAGGNYAHTAKVTTTTPFFQTTATPLFQNNETLFTLVYNYNSAPWTITPYFQYTHVPAASSIGAFTSASTYGGAILANYTFGEDTPLSGVSLPIRFEYISSTGSLASGLAQSAVRARQQRVVGNPDADQYKIFFARAEFSHVAANSTTSGLAFGRDGMNTTQTRVLFETGILF